MAVLCRLSLRVLWISCLLISSVTCVPTQEGHGSPGPVGSMRWSLSSGSSIPREYYAALKLNDDQAPTGNDAVGIGSGSGKPGLGSVGTGSSSSNFGSTGGDDGYFDFSSDGQEERPQPVFSDVSNMEPVYIFRSRSGYRNGRRHFSKTRYTPGEIVFPPRTVVGRIPNQPIKASRQGGQ